MYLYRVLLVDDEPEIRQGISQKMDWETLGFTLVGECENGKDALEQAELLQPDLVLTDIQMPFLDGLELCRLVATRLPATKFIVFSGFDEFTYAQQAVQLNISEYILKPINAQELAQVLTRLKETLDAQRANQQNIELLQQQYQENLPLLREIFLTRLIEARMSSDEIIKRSTRLGLTLTNPSYLVALLEFHGGAMDKELNAIALQQLLEQYFQWDCPFFLFFYNDSIAMVVGLEDTSTPYPFIDQMNHITKLAHSYLEITLTVGVGRVCTQLENLSLSNQEAKNALDYRVLLGEGKALYIGDISPTQNTALTFTQQQEQEILRCIKLGDPIEIKEIIENIVGALYLSSKSLWESQLYFMELVTCILKLVRSLDFSPEEIFSEAFAGTQLKDFTNQQELVQWLTKHCLGIHENIRKQHSDTTWHTVEKAKTFISEHFSQPELSIESLCHHLHLSPTYFSTLFKTETSVTFTTYVTHVRMEEARRLLQTTEDKTYIIGEKVGYSDSNYFSYVFKKHFGMSPTKFRTSGEK